jgi:hypothetical protein
MLVLIDESRDRGIPLLSLQPPPPPLAAALRQCPVFSGLCYSCSAPLDWTWGDALFLEWSLDDALFPDCEEGKPKPILCRNKNCR